MSDAISISASTACRLWIDGVGVFLIWFPAELTIGNAFLDDNAHSKLSLLADIRTEHLQIERTGENYFAMPHGATQIDNIPLIERQSLPESTTITLNDSVQLQIDKPSPLSVSRVITFPSHHQRQPRTDSVVMFDRTCILGSNEQSHIRCVNMEHSIVLFERDDQLWAKSSEEFRSNSASENTKMTPLTYGSTLTGEGWQFRIEKGFSP